MNVTKLWIPLAALVLALASPGQAQEQDEPAPAPAQLSKGDGMLIHIAGVGGDLPTYREIVDSQGNIDLPFLGPLAAEGKSLSALEAEIAAAYANAKLGPSPTVTITYVTHFDPPPDRSRLVRIQDPRQPVPAPVEESAAPAP